MIIPLGTQIARGLMRPTRELGRATLDALLFGLAPGGVYRAPMSPPGPVSSYLTVSPLPREETGASLRGGLFSVALSSRRRDSALRSTLPCGARTFLPPASRSGSPGQRSFDLLYSRNVGRYASVGPPRRPRSTASLASRSASRFRSRGTCMIA